MIGYPPIPSLIDEVHTHASGASQSLGLRMRNDVLPVDGFEIDDLGSLHQVVGLKIRDSASAIVCLESPMFRLHLYDKTADTVTEKPHSDFGTSTLDDSVEGTATIRYDDASTGAYVVIRVRLEKVGAMTVAAFRLIDADTADPNLAIHTYDLPLLRIQPFGPKRSISGWLPTGNGEVVPEALFPGGNLIPTGNQSTNNHPVELSIDRRHPFVGPQSVRSRIDIASIPLIAFYSLVSGSCVALRGNDYTGRTKRFLYHSDDGNSLLIWASHHPEDNLETATAASPYDTQLLLLRGTYEEALAAHRYLMEVEGAPWLKEREKLQTITTHFRYGGDQVSEHVFKHHYAVWLAPHSADPGKTDGEVYARMNEEIDRIIAFIGLDPMVFAYGWGEISDGTDRILSDKMQDHRMTVDFKAFANARSYPVFLYSILQEWYRTSRWFQLSTSVDPVYGHDPLLGDPDDYIAEDRDGNDHPSGLGADFSWPNFGHPNARAHTVDFSRHWLDPNIEPTAIEGVYLDAFAGGPGDSISDYRATLDPSQKGPGSNFNALGKVQVVKDLRDTIRALPTREQLVLFSEFADETMVSAMDMVSIKTELIQSITGRIVHLTNAFAHLYSDRLFFFSFTSWIEPTATSGLLVEMNAVRAAIQFNSGIMPVLGWFGRFDNYIIMDPADPDYQAHWVDSGHGAFMGFLRDMIVARSKGLAVFMGRRLPALPGSLDRNILSRGFTGVVDPDTFVVSVKGDLLVGSAWLWNSLTWGRVITVWLTNVEPAARTVRLRMSRDRYPEIGLGQNFAFEGFDPLTSFREILDIELEVPGYGIRRIDIYDRNVFGD